MVDVMGTQFDKLTTKLDVFVDEIRTGNALIEKLSSIVERQFMAFERVFVTSERQVQYSERQILAIEKWNELFIEQVSLMHCNSTFQYLESNIWNLLVDINIQDE